MTLPRAVLTVGTFDTPHFGHGVLITRAAALGTRLVVGLNSDAYVKRYKGKKPVFSYQERQDILLQDPRIDAVVCNEQDDLKPLLAQIRPAYLVIGSDWADRYIAQIQADAQYLQYLNTALVYVPYTTGISSTILKHRLKEEHGAYSSHSNA
jgi:glycerol-3-phosphate cytidylyltransferase